MAEEYSYYLLSGETRQSVIDVLEGNREIEDLKRKVYAELNIKAIGMDFRRDRHERPRIDGFFFALEEHIPEGWTPGACNSDFSANNPGIFAVPPSALLPAVERAAHKWLKEAPELGYSIDITLGNEDIPNKQIPPKGYCCTAFVRAQTYKDPATPAPAYQIPDGITLPRPDSIGYMQDEMVAVQIEGDLYLRVPKTVNYAPPEEDGIYVQLHEMQSVEKTALEKIRTAMTSKRGSFARN